MRNREGRTVRDLAFASPATTLVWTSRSLAVHDELWPSRDERRWLAGRCVSSTEDLVLCERREGLVLTAPFKKDASSMEVSGPACLTPDGLVVRGGDFLVLQKPFSEELAGWNTSVVSVRAVAATRDLVAALGESGVALVTSRGVLRNRFPCGGRWIGLSLKHVVTSSPVVVRDFSGKVLLETRDELFAITLREIVGARPDRERIRFYVDPRDVPRAPLALACERCSQRGS